jgi:hypothetical protein
VRIITCGFDIEANIYTNRNKLGCFQNGLKSATTPERDKTASDTSDKHSSLLCSIIEQLSLNKSSLLPKKQK